MCSKLAAALLLLSCCIAPSMAAPQQFGFQPAVTSFDYDYAAEPRDNTAENSSTERPLVRVWNSFVRGVSPAFNLGNLTNPLANLFNDGSTNIIETTPLIDLQALNVQLNKDPYEDNTPHSTHSQHRRKQRKPAKKRKTQKRQRIQPVYDYPYANSKPNDEHYTYYKIGASVSSMAANEAPQSMPMFFFDADSNSYYAVQRFSAQDYHDQEQIMRHFYEPQEPESTDQQQSKRVSSGKHKVNKLRPLANPTKRRAEDAAAANDDYEDDDVDSIFSSANQNQQIDKMNDSNAADADAGSENTAAVTHHYRQRSNTKLRHNRPKSMPGELYFWLRPW